MGIGFVLLLWAVVGLVLATIGAAVLAGGTARLTRHAHAGRRRVVAAAAAFPFACLVWAGFVFVLQAVVNEGLLHRDLGMGDTWHAPLPNGYQIMMIDVTDQGWVYNPKTQGSDSGVGEQEDAVAGVRKVQVAGSYIFGSTDSKSFEHLGQESDQVDSYFLLNTETGKRMQFQNYDALHSRAEQLNINLNLEPIYTVYGRFRFSWFDVFTGLLFCIPPLLGFALLITRIVRLRRTQVLPAS